MKIDQDYIKQLLEAFEASPGPVTNIDYLKEQGCDYETDEFVFHAGILADKGPIAREDGCTGFGLERGADGHISWGVVPLRMTAEGYEFLSTIRDPEVWRRTKESAAKVGGLGLDLFIDLAKMTMKDFLKEKLGLKG